MKFPAAILLILICFAINVFSQDDTRSFVLWRVLKFDVTANLPTAGGGERVLTAKAILNLQNAGNTAGSKLTLRINEKAVVSAVRVNNSSAVFNKIQDEKSGATNVQRVSVNLPSVQPNGEIAVAVDYTLKVNENSAFSSISETGSQFLPLSYWYPAPNNYLATLGADFAPFALHVNSADQTIISSGSKINGGFEQKLFAQPFFLTGNWDAVEQKGVTVYLPKGVGEIEKQRASELAALSVEANTFLASLLGTAPSVPLKIVAVRRGTGFADAGTLLLDKSIFRRQKIDSETAMQIAEAVAKLWLGNIKAAGGENYGLIRNGLARYIATQFIEKQFGKEAAETERFRQREAYALVAGSDLPINKILPADAIYFSTLSNRGAMIWRRIALKIGQQQLFEIIKSQESYNVNNLTKSLAGVYPTLDKELTTVNKTNLMVGLPQGGRVATRNLGEIPVDVNVEATTDRGEKLVQKITIQPLSFSDVTFNTPNKIVRTEIDPEKFYAQTDYSDDVAPREFKETNPLITIKRLFDARDFSGAEKSARTLLAAMSYFGDARVWLGRALLGQNKTAEAEQEFKKAIDDKLPSPMTLAWANVGLGEIAAKSAKPSAADYFETAIKVDAEYGSNYSARINRNKLSQNSPVDDSVKNFFAQFDKAAVSGNKSSMSNLAIAGEMDKFIGGIGGQAEQWQTTVSKVDVIDGENILAEVQITLKLLNREPESGLAVFQLSKLQGNWKLSGVQIFEVH